jgi:perosamine synthetase
MTFAATANAVVYCGGTPIFADVEPDTLLIDPVDVARRVTPRTRGIVAVDYAGQPADYPALRAVADRHGLFLAADACHALGGSLDGRPVGSLADASTFSFHPVKPIATGEGGAVTTADEHLARRMKIFRNHGITSDHRSRESAGAHRYEMVSLGFNYRLSDIQCALGCSQLDKLPRWVARRQAIAAAYDASFAATRAYRPLSARPGCSHAYHLYVVRCARTVIGQHRDDVFSLLRRAGIGTNVHYPPVHLHPYYRERFATGPGLCPNAEQAYDEILSLPIFPAMTDTDVGDVLRGIAQLAEVAAGYQMIVPDRTSGTSVTAPGQLAPARSA